MDRDAHPPAPRPSFDRFAKWFRWSLLIQGIPESRDFEGKDLKGGEVFVPKIGRAMLVFHRVYRQQESERKRSSRAWTIGQEKIKALRGRTGAGQVSSTPKCRSNCPQSTHDKHHLYSSAGRSRSALPSFWKFTF